MLTVESMFTPWLDNLMPRPGNLNTLDNPIISNQYLFLYAQHTSSKFLQAPGTMSEGSTECDLTRQV